MENDRIDMIFREKLGELSDLPPEVKWTSEKGWKDYEKKYGQNKRHDIRTLLYLSSAAALFLIVLLLFPAIREHGFKTLLVSNNTDETKELVLPDGNRIWLNSHSTIQYPSKIDKDHSEFTVDGEVYFEIRNQLRHAFKIKAHNAHVLAENPCGFNIRARMQEDNVNITVATGAVKIMEESYGNGLALLLTEGSYCSVHKSQNLVYSSINRNENYLAWKTGKLDFKQTPMATVTDILAEYYHKHIELEDKSLAYCLFSGSFNDQSIEVILHRMQTDLDFVIRNSGDKIMISGKGCF